MKTFTQCWKQIADTFCQPLTGMNIKRMLTTHLEDNGLVVFLEIVSKDVGVHERLSTEAEHVDGFLEELHLDPRHVVLLHLFHAQPDARVQLSPKHK